MDVTWTEDSKEIEESKQLWLTPVRVGSHVPNPNHCTQGQEFPGNNNAAECSLIRRSELIDASPHHMMPWMDQRASTTDECPTVVKANGLGFGEDGLRVCTRITSRSLDLIWPGRFG